MFNHHFGQRFRIATAAAFTALAATAASAQVAATADEVDDVVAAARNQLAVLEYCQAQGHIDGKAIEVQNQLSATLPAATDTAKVASAYEKGKSGTISVMGNETSLADAAETRGTTEEALCQQIASAVEEAGTQTN
ncbi:pore-forming ESAT-6 family protein [Paenirhodobacter populi]|uniref:pore-forming ESAT-6 family protein n=1 Tax=Paenirhodobacter populi TaxID=2306993 RepID=UPI001F4DE404|nr:pore-forming ESAT-6 family protein [Sinirhodobacter populi]